MDDAPLEIAPPRRAFLFIFLITGVVLLLNGLAVLVFASIPQPAGAIRPGFGVGGWMPIVAGLLCLSGAGWMLNRHRQIARIIHLVQAELPPDGSSNEARSRLVRALIARAEDLQGALSPFPDTLVTVELVFDSAHILEIQFSGQCDVSGSLAPVDDRLAKLIESSWEGIRHEDEVLLDFGKDANVIGFAERFPTELLKLPPDFTLAGNVRLSRRAPSQPM